MFETDWVVADHPLIGGVPKMDFATRLPRSRVQSTLWTVWREHCVECAVPECYATCALYRRRRDGACQRFTYGIHRNRAFQGRYDFGADIQFRRWGKLETNLGSWNSPVNFLPLSDWAERQYFRLAPRWRSNVAAIVRRMPGAVPTELDAFVVECFSPDSEKFQLILEYFTADDGITRIPQFRTSFEVHPGQNYFTVPFARFGMSKLQGYVYVAPEESETDRRLIFTWLDFVQFVQTPPHEDPPSVPAPRVKCLAWDLDNTLWEGVLIESEDVRLRPAAIEAIRRLDERGILQTIVSKNDHDQAWGQLVRLGIDEYFLCPAICWGPKSSGLRDIAKQLNLGIDSFAVIDDSAFERAEISSVLPSVRVYSDQEIGRLIEKPEFNVAVTEESRRRRSMYRVDASRFDAKSSFAGPESDFLRSCQLEMQLFVPRSEAEIERCHELLQRSNQLNLSGNRYTREELEALISSDRMIGIAFRCSDRFGDYGIVGFSAWKERESGFEISDLVISCRIAQKGIEQAYFRLMAECVKRGQITAALRATDRNGPLRNALSEIGFRNASDGVLVVDVADVICQDIVRVVVLDACISDFFRGVAGDGCSQQV